MQVNSAGNTGKKQNYVIKFNPWQKFPETEVIYNYVEVKMIT